MWLTSWWVAWLLNFYGFSHTNCMVFYRTPWTRYGIPWNCIGTSGNPMAFHGTLQYSLEFHGPPRKLHGISWHSMELHHYFMELCGTPWHSMELHGIPWNCMDTPWKFRGISCISMDFHGIPWIFIDFHGFPWNSMEVFHTNFLQISYIHSLHLCSHSIVSPSFPNVEPSVFWSTEMTANPNQHWGEENHTSVSRFVMSIVFTSVGCGRVTEHVKGNHCRLQC